MGDETFDADLRIAGLFAAGYIKGLQRAVGSGARVAGRSR
jgi:hypothetical protein